MRSASLDQVHLDQHIDSVAYIACIFTDELVYLHICLEDLRRL
jgi:hypothetical protein